jgi:uncharacterized protein (UPF0335 family)
MSEHEHKGFQVPPPVVKNEINLNTLALAVGLALSVGGFVYSTGQFTASVGELSRNMATMQSTIATWQAKTDARLDSAELGLNRYESMNYRLGKQEEAAVAIADSVQELKDKLSAQGTDLRVIREILTRIDKNQTQNSGTE